MRVLRASPVDRGVFTSVAIRRRLPGILLGTLAAILPCVHAQTTTLSMAAPLPADRVFVHGKIHTENAHRDVAQALAIRGNTIVAVGTDAVVRAYEGSKTQIIDLKGRVMLPGLIDAHVHPAMSAQMSSKCSLEDKSAPFATIKAVISNCLRHNPGDPALWYETVMVNPTGTQLTAKELDEILMDRPLMLEGSDGHSVWLNSAALRAAHIERDTPDPAGGRIMRDADGNPSGPLRDNATLLGIAAAPTPSLEFETAQLQTTLDQMRAVGITSVQDAAVDDHWMSLYKKLYDEKHLNMRVRGSFYLKDLMASPAAIIEEAKAFRARWAIDPDFLRADAVKIFADGVVEYPSQTAALLEPYLDGHGKSTANRGPSYFTPEGLDQIVSAADAAGLTVHIHAIGDRAVRSSLDAFAAARRQNGDLDNRDQIAHLELIDPADFARFKSLRVIANFQLLWAQRDAYIDRGTIPYLGSKRSQYLYPAGSLKAAGALIVGGSDWGVSSFDAFIAMEHGITRSQSKGKPPLLPGQALTIADTVDAYTINAAFALKQEKTTGSLEAGKRADLILLDRDIFALDPYDLHKTHVLFTYLDGREVYHASPVLNSD